jgi:hypothetical protein
MEISRLGGTGPDESATPMTPAVIAMRKSFTCIWSEEKCMYDSYVATHIAYSASVRALCYKLLARTKCSWLSAQARESCSMVGDEPAVMVDNDEMAPRSWTSIATFADR